jgi:hypothetical protein
MSARRLWVRPLWSALFLAALVGLLARYGGFQLRGPHQVRVVARPLDADKQDELEQALSRIDPRTPEAVLRFALDFTASSLTFDLAHPTRLTFGRGSRPGNCIEYAYLFSQAYNAGAKRAGLSARARPVHGPDARVFGLKVPVRGRADHDWALVMDRGEPVYVDPTLYDHWLGWDIALNVDDDGSLHLP